MITFKEVIIGLVYIAATVTGQCSRGVSTRREIRDLTPAQRTAYFNAVKVLHSGTDMFTTFVSAHYNNVPQAHGVPAFFPWHRRFLYLYELYLQQIDATVVLPYWDWSRDSQAPEKSPIFTASYLGGNGRSGDRCVINGTFANWQTKVPNSHCLRRDFDNGNAIPAFYSPESLEAIIRQTTVYDDLRTGIEGGPHGAVHVGIGGNNGDMSFMYSPNDPIFYLHHAFIDLLWSEWQTRNPSLAKTYNGGSVKPTDNMIPFNVQVQSTFNTTALCYKYPRFNANLPSSNTVQRRGNINNRNKSSFQSNIRQRQQINQVDSDNLHSQPQAKSKGARCRTKHDNNFGKHGRGKHRHAKLASFIQGFANRHGCRSVDSKDRVTRNKIRIPDPLPEQYIINNKLELEEVRYQESLLANLTLALNDTPDFVPQAELPIDNTPSEDISQNELA